RTSCRGRKKCAPSSPGAGRTPTPSCAKRRKSSAGKWPADPSALGFGLRPEEIPGPGPISFDPAAAFLLDFRGRRARYHAREDDGRVRAEPGQSFVRDIGGAEAVLGGKLVARRAAPQGWR